MIFAHDHGLIFYLDLVYYMLRLNAQRYLVEGTAKYQIFEDETLTDYCNPGFKLIFAMTVSTEPRNIPIKSALDAAAKLSKEQSFNNFEFTIVQSEACDWPAEQLAQIVPKDARKVLLSIPEAAEAKMTAQLTALGIAPGLISIVSPN